MVEISIVSLIYKSPQLAEAVYESVKKYTPLLTSGKAEFFFVANDPTEDVVEFLRAKNIPHYININERLSDEELFSRGFGAPEYIRRVYQGYNYGILQAKGQKLVLINSDNFFSEDWLENLLKYSDYKKVVCATLIEPGQSQAGVFPFATEKHFGRMLDDFEEDKFQDFAQKISKTGYSSGGAYMPCLLYKDIAVMAGLYPEGNIANKSFNEISRFGDEYFYDRLKEFGVEHITAKDSIVYHLKEGEKSESSEEAKLYKAKRTEHLNLNERLVVHPNELLPYIYPETKHHDIIDALGQKITALIISPENMTEVNTHLKTIKNFDFKNIETVIISDDKKLLKHFEKQGKTVYAIQEKTDKAVYNLFHAMYGEHLLVMHKECTYEKDLLNGVTDRNNNYYFGNEDRIEGVLDETIDYTGYLIISKKALVNQIPMYLELIMAKGKKRINLVKLGAVDISRPKPQELRSASEPLTARNIPRRLARKVKKDGISGLTRLAAKRALKR